MNDSAIVEGARINIDQSVLGFRIMSQGWFIHALKGEDISFLLFCCNDVARVSGQCEKKADLRIFGAPNRFEF